MSNIAQLPQWFLATYIFLVGLCIGSFLNVAILRGLSGEDIVFDRSKCPKCKNQLKWYMNIPLLSYIFLGGKCAFCKEKISFQYPLVEFITAILYLVTFLVFGFSLKTLFLCIFFALFVAMSATDFKETVIIDLHAYILLGFGLLYSFLKIGNIDIIQAIIGTFFGFIIFEIMARLGKLFCGCRMFGEGDSLIALGLGAIFGWKSLLIIIILSFLIQTIFAIPILILNCINKKKIKLAISYSTTFILLFYVILNNHFKFIENGWINYLQIFVICTVLIWALLNILKEIKEKAQDETKNEEEKFNLMPFGPALLISATVCVFYLEQIKSYILDFIS